MYFSYFSDFFLQFFSEFALQYLSLSISTFCFLSVFHSFSGFCSRKALDFSQNDLTHSGFKIHPKKTTS